MSTAKQNLTAAFYWIGVAMTLACFALVLAGNTELLWRFEHRAFPLSWAVAGMAVLAFLVAEFSSAQSLPEKNNLQSAALVREFEAAEL